MVLRLLPYFLLVCFVAVLVVIFFPFPPRGSRENAHRAWCQSNLKQIGLALQQYRQDNGDQFPLRTWVASATAYAKTDAVFQCPETPFTMGTSDYFLNAQLLGVSFEKLETADFPAQIILGGDGQDDATLATTLVLLPAVWRKNQKSPAFRHLETANYLFADGHVKSLKVDKIGADFRMVRS